MRFQSTRRRYQDADLLFVLYSPETKDRTLVEIDQLYAAGVPVWKMRGKLVASV